MYGQMEQMTDGSACRHESGLRTLDRRVVGEQQVGGWVADARWVGVHAGRH